MESYENVVALAAALTGPNAETAMRRLVTLSDEGNPHALVQVGVLCWLGELVPLDVRRALQLFAEAAALGHGEACHLIAAVYANGGPDFPPNPVKVRLFRDRGHELGVRLPDGAGG